MKTYTKKIYLIILGLLFTTNLLSQVTLTGKVTEKKTGLPLFGVDLFFTELKVGAATDTSGIYNIVHLPKRKLLLKISSLGYKTLIEEVDLGKTTIMDFSLEESPEEMNEVVVTGTSKATEVKRNPVPILVLDRKGIDQNLNTNIIDAIAKLPGIDAVTTGPNISKPFIRGLGYNRVLTLFDGVRQEGQQWGDEHGIEVDQNDISRVEIVKGPASLIYGSDALAGVVNLIPFPPARNGTLKGDFLAGYQTNNGLYAGSFAEDGNNKD